MGKGCANGAMCVYRSISKADRSEAIINAFGGGVYSMAMFIDGAICATPECYR